MPINKRASKAAVRNYRPVSLLSIVSKIMETIINRQIVNHLERHIVLSPRQFGFSRGLGTADLLTALHHECSGIVGRNGIARLVAVDIAGAFDKVSHTGILHKAEMSSIGGSILSWLHSYLQERKMRAVVGGQTSSHFSIQAGVPQSSMLGPTLFLIYVNDISDCVSPDCQLASYADDTTLYCLIRADDVSPATFNSLQVSLDDLQAWGSRWKVQFEPTKCQGMSMSRRSTPLPPSSLSFDGTVIREETDVKLLGVTFDRKLLFRSHLHQVTVRASSALASSGRCAQYSTATATSAYTKASSAQPWNVLP